MLSQEQILEKLKTSGALLQGHFKLPSGRHSLQLVECARILQYPWHAEELCGELASRFKDKQVGLVMGAAVGGIVVAFEIARQLNIPAVFTERVNGVMSLRRGFSIRSGQRILIAEDEVITGRSIREIIRLVEERGGIIVGITALLNRSKGEEGGMNYPFEALAELETKTYEPEECPLCKKNIPISRMGRRPI